MAKSILIGLILLSALRTGLLAPRRFTRGQDLGEVKWEKNTSTASQFRKLHEGHSNVKNSVDSNEALEPLLLNNVLGTQSAVKATKTVSLKNKARIKTTEDATTVQIDPTPAPSPVLKLPTRSSLYTEEAHKTEKKIRDVTMLHDVSGSPLTTGKPEANLPTPQETASDTVDLGYFFASQVGQVSTLQRIRTIHRLSEKSDTEDGLGLQRNKRKTRSVTQTPLLSSTLMPDEIAVKSTSVPTSSFSSVSLLDYQTLTSTQNSIISQDPLADNVQKQEVSTAPSAIATEDMSDEPILVEVKAESLRSSLPPSDPSNETGTLEDLIPSETYSVTQAILSVNSMPLPIAEEVMYLPVDVSYLEVEEAQTSSQEPNNLVNPISLSVKSSDEHEASTHVPNLEITTTQSKPANPDNEYFTSTKEHLAPESSSTNPIEFTAIPFVAKDATQVETVDRTTEASAVETSSMTPLPEKKPSNGNSTTLDDLVPSETEPASKNNTFKLNDIRAGLTELPISAVTSGITSGYEVTLTLARESRDKVITQASTPSLVTEHHTTDASVTHSSPAYLHQEVDENQEKGLTTTDSSIHPLEPSESTLIATEVTQAETVDYAWEVETITAFSSSTQSPEKIPSIPSNTLHSFMPTETESLTQNVPDKQSEGQAHLTQLPPSTTTSAISPGDETIVTLAHESENEVTTAASTPPLATEDDTPDASTTPSSPSYLHQQVDENQEKGLTSTDSSIDQTESATESSTFVPNEIPADLTDLPVSAIASGYEVTLTLASESRDGIITQASTPSVATEDHTTDASVTHFSPSHLHQEVDKNQDKGLTGNDSSIGPLDPAESTLISTEVTQAKAVDHDLEVETFSSSTQLPEKIPSVESNTLHSLMPTETESLTQNVTDKQSEGQAYLTQLPTFTITSAISSGDEAIVTSAHESDNEVTTAASMPSIATEDDTSDASTTHSSPSYLDQEVDKNQETGLISTYSSIHPLEPSESTLIATEATEAKTVGYAWEVETCPGSKAFSSSTQLPEKISPVESNTLHSLMSTETESLIHNVTDKQSEGQAHLTQLPTTTITSAISSSDETIGTLAHESENEVTTAASTPSLATGVDIPDASTTHSSPSYLDQEVDKNREKGLTSTDSSTHPLDPSESTSIATEVTQAKTVDYAWELETCLGSKAFSSSTQLPEKIPSVEKGLTNTGSSIYPPDFSESPLATSQQSESPNHLVDFLASTIASVNSSDDEAKITLAQEFDHGVTTSASFSSVSTNDNIPDSLTTHSVSVPVGQIEASEATAATATELTTLSALSELMSSTSSSNRHLEQDGITFESIPSTTEDIESLPDPLRLISDDPAVVTTAMSPSSETNSTDSSRIIIEEVAPTLNPETFIPTSIIPATPTTEAPLLQTESEPFAFARDLTFVESETQPGVSGNGVTEGIPLDSTANRESVTHSLDLELVLPTQETISDAMAEKPSVAPITSASLDVTSERMETEPDDEAETTESDLSRSEQSSAKTVEFPDFSPESPPSLTITNDDTFSQASTSLPTFSDAVEPSQGVSDSSEETSTDSLGTSTDPNEDTSEENELDPATVTPVSVYATKPDLPNQAEETDDDTEATEEPQTMVLPTGGNGKTNFHKATGPLTNLLFTAKAKAQESPFPEEEDERSEQGVEEAKEDEDEKDEEGKEEEKEDERAEYGEEEEEGADKGEDKEEEGADKGEEEEEEGAEKREEERTERGEEEEVEIEEGEEAEKGADNAEEEEGGTEKGEEEDKDNADSLAGESPSSTEGETSHTSLEPNMSARSYSTESGKEPVENSDSSTELSKSSFGYSRTSTSKRPSQYSSSPEEPSVSAGIENSDEDLRPSTPTYQNFREASSSIESQSDEYTRPTYSRYFSTRPGIKNVLADVTSDRRADNTWARVSNLNEFASAATAVLDTTLASLLYASETPLQHATSSASSQEVHPSVSPTSLSSSPSITSLPTTTTEPTAFSSLEKPSKEDSSWPETTLVTNPTTTTEKESFLFTGTPVTITFATLSTKEPLADKLYTFEPHTTPFSNPPPTPVWFSSEQGAPPRQLTNLTSKEIEQDMSQFFARWKSQTNDLKTIPPLSTSDSGTFNSFNTSDLPIPAPNTDVSIAKFTVLQNSLTQLGSFIETRRLPELVQEGIPSFSENLRVKLNNSQVDPSSTAFPLITSTQVPDKLLDNNSDITSGTASLSSSVDLLGDKQSIEAFFQKWQTIIRELSSQKNSSNIYDAVALTPTFTLIPTQFSSTPSSSTQPYRQARANLVTESVISSRLKPLEIPQRRVYSTTRPLKFRLVTAAPPYLSKKGNASNDDVFFRKLLHV